MASCKIIDIDSNQRPKDSGKLVAEVDNVLVRENLFRAIERTHNEIKFGALFLSAHDESNPHYIKQMRIFRRNLDHYFHLYGQILHPSLDYQLQRKLVSRLMEHFNERSREIPFGWVASEITQNLEVLERINFN